MSTQIVVQEKPFPLRGMYKKEMCASWNLTLHQLNRMLEEIENEIGGPVGRRYYPPQLEIFSKKYGLPGMAIKVSP